MNAPLRATPTMSSIELVTIQDGQAVTTTLAIAAGTDIEHASVIKLVRTYQADLEDFGPIGFEIQMGAALPQGGFGRSTEYATLTEQQSTLLLTYMRNGPVVRAFKKALVVKFFEMRSRLAAPALPNFRDPSAAARAWADEVDAKQLAVAKVAQLEHQVAEQAPSVAGLKRIADADGTMCIRDAASALKMRPIDLTNWLVSHYWIYQRPGKKGYLAYGTRLQSLDLRYNVFPYDDKNTGEKKVSEQVRITKKGLTTLAVAIAAPDVRSSPPPWQQGTLIQQ